MATPAPAPAPPPSSAPVSTGRTTPSRPTLLPPARSRRWNAALWLGAWSTTSGEGVRTWPLSFGASGGYELLAERLELGLSLGTASTVSAGGPFASGTLARGMGLVRALGVYRFGDLCAVGGLGAGAVLLQSHYSIAPPGQTPFTLDAATLKPAGGVIAGVRYRPWSGLEARGELTLLLRDGRSEWVPSLGLGWAF